jgi:hypothetical protein
VLRRGDGTMAPVWPIIAPKPRIWAKCISTMSGPCLKG